MHDRILLDRGCAINKGSAGATVDLSQFGAERQSYCPQRYQQFLFYVYKNGRNFLFRAYELRTEHYFRIAILSILNWTECPLDPHQHNACAPQYFVTRSDAPQGKGRTSKRTHHHDYRLWGRGDQKESDRAWSSRITLQKKPANSYVIEIVTLIISQLPRVPDT